MLNSHQKHNILLSAVEIRLVCEIKLLCNNTKTDFTVKPVFLLHICDLFFRCRLATKPLRSRTLRQVRSLLRFLRQYQGGTLP